MRILIEMDGPLFDVRPAYWQVYQQVVSEMGLAQVDSDTFWRLVRTGASEGQLLRGSKPRHWKQYRARFDAVSESDEIVSLFTPRPEAVEALRPLRRRHELHLLITGANVSAREHLLSQHGWTAHFDGASGVSGKLEDRALLLRKLASGSPAIVAAASDGLGRAADEAGVPCVGVSNGPCTGKRLTQTGAREVYDDLGALSDAILGGKLGRIQPP